MQSRHPLLHLLGNSNQPFAVIQAKIPISLNHINVVGAIDLECSDSPCRKFRQFSSKKFPACWPDDHHIPIVFLNNTKIVIPEVANVVAPLTDRVWLLRRFQRSAIWGLSRNGAKNYSKGPCVTFLE